MSEVQAVNASLTIIDPMTSDETQRMDAVHVNIEATVESTHEPQHIATDAETFQQHENDRTSVCGENCKGCNGISFGSFGHWNEDQCYVQHAWHVKLAKKMCPRTT
jgi:hypothetical protein